MTANTFTHWWILCRKAHWQKFRQELEQKRQKSLSGVGTGSWAIDRNNKTTGSFGSSEHNWEVAESIGTQL